VTDDRWPTQLQAQLVATANGVDRANRPTLFLALPAIALLAAIIAVLPIWARFSIARETLRSQQRDWGSVRLTIDEVVKRRNARPDLAKIFPKNQLFGSNIETEAKAVWPGVSLPVHIPEPVPRPFLATQTDLKKLDIECTIGNVRLEQLSQWIDRVLRSPHLRGVFVSNLELRPVTNGWNGTVTFRRYEYTPGSATP